MKPVDYSRPASGSDSKTPDTKLGLGPHSAVDSCPCISGFQTSRLTFASLPTDNTLEFFCLPLEMCQFTMDSTKNNIKVNWLNCEYLYYLSNVSGYIIALPMNRKWCLVNRLSMKQSNIGDDLRWSQKIIWRYWTDTGNIICLSGSDLKHSSLYHQNIVFIFSGQRFKFKVTSRGRPNTFTITKERIGIKVYMPT